MVQTPLDIYKRPSQWVYHILLFGCHTVPTQFQSAKLENKEQSQDIIVSIRIFEFRPKLMSERLEFVHHQYALKCLKIRKQSKNFIFHEDI